MKHVAVENATVLFSAIRVEHTAVREWLPVACLLRDRGFEPIFMIDDSCPPEWQEKCHQLGIRTHKENMCSTRSDSTKQRRSGLVGLFRRGYIKTFFSFLDKLKTAKRIVSDIRPVAIVLYTDAYDVESSALVAAANAAGTPSLVVPLAGNFLSMGTAIQRWGNLRLWNRLSLDRPINRFYAFLFPSWVVDVHGDRMFYHSIRHNLCAMLLGVLPRYPYCRAGGKATKVAAISEIEREVLMDEGVAESKVVMTGRPWYDVVHNRLRDQEATRRQICQDLGLDSSKKIVLYNVPYYCKGFDSDLPGKVHWQEIESTLGTFASFSEINVVMSFHPGVPIADYREVAQKHGAVICPPGVYDVSELIAVSDILVSQTSSTVPLAIGANKPTVILYYYASDPDCTHTRWYQFEPKNRILEQLFDETGCLMVWKREELSPLLQKLIEDDDFYRGAADAQRRIVRDWIVLDGKCSQRVADEVMTLARGTRSEPGRRMKEEKKVA